MIRLKTNVVLSVLLSLVGLVGCSQPDATDNASEIAAIHVLLTKIEDTFAAGDLEAAMQVFTTDAILLPADSANIEGIAAIRSVYEGMLQQFQVGVAFNTREIEVTDGLAYEQGTYTLKLTDKQSGAVVSDAQYRHVHILKKQADGSWKTWRMLTNSESPANP
jgi:uncharacterized protein (TIGR02246 family)